MWQFVYHSKTCQRSCRKSILFYRLWLAKCWGHTNYHSDTYSQCYWIQNFLDRSNRYRLNESLKSWQTLVQRKTLITNKRSFQASSRTLWSNCCSVCCRSKSSLSCSWTCLCLPLSRHYCILGNTRKPTQVLGGCQCCCFSTHSNLFFHISLSYFISFVFLQK